jgi:hypothetical protein
MVGLTNALQGMARSEAQFNRAADRIAHLPPAQTKQGDQVDLSTPAVALLQSKNSFEANTKVVKVADQMEQTLLDMTG